MSCKKENELDKNNKQKKPSVSNMARTVVDGDAALLIVNEVHKFKEYAEAFQTDPKAEIPNGLIATGSAEDAVRIIENTANYYNAQFDPYMGQRLYDSISIALNYTEDALKIEDIAEAYNSALESATTWVTNNAHEDGKVVLVDVEYENKEGKCYLNILVEYGYDAITLPYPHTFGTGDTWSTGNLGGRIDGAYLGTSGAPAVLEFYTKKDLGLIPSIAFPSPGVFPTNITLVTTLGGTGCFGSAEYSTSVNNPMVSTYMYVDNYYRTHHYHDNTNINTDDWITPDGMQFYRDNIPYIITNGEICTSKDILDYKIYTTTTFGTLGYTFHYIDAKYATFVSMNPNQ